MCLAVIFDKARPDRGYNSIRGQYGITTCSIVVLLWIQVPFFFSRPFSLPIPFLFLSLSLPPPDSMTLPGTVRWACYPVIPKFARSPQTKRQEFQPAFLSLSFSLYYTQPCSLTCVKPRHFSIHSLPFDVWQITTAYVYLWIILLTVMRPSASASPSDEAPFQVDNCPLAVSSTYTPDPAYVPCA